MRTYKETFRLPPKIVGIAGRRNSVLIRSAEPWHWEVSLVRCDGILDDITFQPEEAGCRICFTAVQKGRGSLTVWIGEAEYAIPTAVFGEKEFFLCVTVTSNFHYGYDPSTYQDRWSEEHRYLCGHGYHKAVKELLPVYRKHGLPVTWLIDPIVASVAEEDIEAWHLLHNDDYGVLPTSYFFYNALNYNMDRSQEETDAMMRETMRYVSWNFPFYTEICGVDQWVGGVGTHWVESCRRLGFKGIWGMGYDHGSCDTSMFHRGCPWNAYKPGSGNFRIPSKKPTDLWAFQWTVRDILNTVHVPEGASGSVIFSTDPDDIRKHGIMKAQPDYYDSMLREYLANMDHNDYFVFLMHQEDHDSHYPDDNDYLDGFFSRVLPDSRVTAATMQEIVMWLNLKYASEEHPTQCIRMRDIVTCKDTMTFRNMAKPKDWGHYPDIMASFDQHRQVIFEVGAILPYRVYDYDQPYTVDEDKGWPEEDYSGILSVRDWVDAIEIESKEAYQRLPLMIGENIRCVDIAPGMNRIRK